MNNLLQPISVKSKSLLLKVATFEEHDECKSIGYYLLIAMF